MNYNDDLQLVLATGYFGTGPYTASAAGPIVVPEPATLALAAIAMVALLGTAWWRRWKPAA